MPEGVLRQRRPLAATMRARPAAPGRHRTTGKRAFMRRGIVYASLAYVIWGAFPIYFKALKGVPATEILAHRMVWSLAFLVVILAALRRFGWVRDLFAKPKVLLWFTGSASLVSVNWGLYIWAVNADRVVDASLGYFINPLVNVVIGALVLREHLRRGQWAAIAIAGAGVLWLTWQAGQLPWIGLLLALTFATYGLMRKTAALGALEGLALETALLFPLAFGYLGWLAEHGSNAFLTSGPALQWLLAAAGPVTAIPLLLFAAGARRIPFSLLGVLQYIGPTLQLLVGVWLYHEPFPPLKIAGYAAIWFALAVYTAESVWQMRRNRVAAAPQSGLQPQSTRGN